MENRIFYRNIYRMVKKLKVVDVVECEAEPAPVEEQAPIVEEESPIPIVEETPSPVPVIEEAAVEAPAQVEEAKPTKPPKKLEYITCETCNKNMLMKTYKYSHQKLCQNKTQPPPSPPQHVESKPKPKRAPKPQQKVENKIEENVESPKPVFNGTVSFNEFQPDPYTVMREQRVMMRQQRVKSLISQAI
jgi:hypothetical protein